MKICLLYMGGFFKKNFNIYQISNIQRWNSTIEHFIHRYSLNEYAVK